MFSVYGRDKSLKCSRAIKTYIVYIVCNINYKVSTLYITSTIETVINEYKMNIQIFRTNIIVGS